MSKTQPCLAVSCTLLSQSSDAEPLGVQSQLVLEDLEVGDGSFSPSQLPVRSQLIAKLQLHGDVQCEEMTGVDLAG